jgi:dihydrofolate reductase
VTTSGKTPLPDGDFVIVDGIDDAVQLTKNSKNPIICGGSTIYEQFLDKDLVRKIHLTVVKQSPDGDKTFPLEKITGKNNWKCLLERDHETHVDYIYYRD